MANPVVIPVIVKEIIVAGNSYAFNMTLRKNKTTYVLTGATITASIQKLGGDVDLIADHTVLITDALLGEATLALTPAETALLVVPRPKEHLQTILHIGDVRVDEGGGDPLVHCGPFIFPVRNPVT